MPRVHFGAVLHVALVLGLEGCQAFDREQERATTIVVGGDVDGGALHAFEKARGRHPTREELLDLHRVYIDNEILYREGLKRGLDGKGTNRESVIFEVLSVIDGQARQASVSEDALRRWFEPRRAQYEHAARFDFEEALLSRDKSEPAVRALVETLNRAENADSHAGLRVFKGRPESNVVQSYGRELAKELARSEPGRWRALRSRDGFRAMRLLAMTPARPAVFETLRETLRRDWTEAMVAEKRAAAVRALWKNYQIEFAEKHQCVADE